MRTYTGRDPDRLKILNGRRLDRHNMVRMIHLLRRIYHTAIPLPLKYGHHFNSKFRFYCKHQNASRDQIEAFRWRRLKTIVTYAYQHVPYYRQLFDKHQLHPDDFRDLSDFRHIPPIHKDDIVANNDILRSDEFEKFRPIQTITSATTRDGMVMYRSRSAETARNAVVWRYWHNLGYRFRDPRVHLTLSNRDDVDNLQPRLDLNENCLEFDQRSITYDNSPAVYRQIKEFSPRMIFSQPSNLVALIHYWQLHNLPPLEVPLCCVLGEKVYPEYREVITNFLGNNLRQYYGNRENTASAGELPDGRLYINSDFVYLEFETDAGEQVSGTPGNIISTGFENYAFPLIRYHTEDVGIYRDYPENAPIGFDTMEIVGGRGRDLLLSRDGLFCPNVTVQLASAKFERYKRVQIEQITIDHVVVRIEPSEDFEPSKDFPIVEKAYQDYFNGRFTAEVQIVNEIPSTPSHKNKLVVSQLALDELRKHTRQSGGQ